MALKVAAGREHVTTWKEGAATKYGLSNGQREISSVRNVRFNTFCKQVLSLDADGDVRKALETAGIAH